MGGLHERGAGEAKRCRCELNNRLGVRLGNPRGEYACLPQHSLGVRQPQHTMDLCCGTRCKGAPAAYGPGSRLSLSLRAPWAWSPARPRCAFARPLCGKRARGPPISDPISQTHCPGSLWTAAQPPSRIEPWIANPGKLGAPTLLPLRPPTVHEEQCRLFAALFC